MVFPEELDLSIVQHEKDQAKKYRLSGVVEHQVFLFYNSTAISHALSGINGRRALCSICENED